MFWQFLLAHFIADYPLQTDWMVEAKRNILGLGLHVGIHAVVLLIIAGAALPELWFHILCLVVIHFGIDFWKNKFSEYKPTMKLSGYFLDQLFHLLSIIGIARFVNVENSSLLANDYAIMGIGYLLVGHVWYITERILNHNNQAYQTVVTQHLWSRLVARSGLLTALLFTPTNWLFIFAISPFIDWPYLAGQYRLRIWLTDISVSITVFSLIWIII